MLRHVAALLLFVSGCALWPLSEADCKPRSWRERGYSDGLAGRHAQDLRLVPECRRLYNVEVAQDDYLAGWRDGYDEWDRLMGSIDLD